MSFRHHDDLMSGMVRWENPAPVWSRKWHYAEPRSLMRTHQMVPRDERKSGEKEQA